MAELFWRDDWFIGELRRKLAAYFAMRFGPLAEAEDFVSFLRWEQFVQRHEQGYFIGPHTDIPTRVATCIFSFADGPGYEELGTEMLVPENRVLRCSGRTHHTWDGFQHVATAPYAPNRLFLFLKT